jgi:hypothetical protein
MHAIILVSEEEEGFVLAFILQNEVSLLTLPDCFGGLILTLRKMRMGILFRWILRLMDWFLGLCRMLSLLNAVFHLCVGLILAITVRSPKRERIMREEWAQAEKVGVDFTGIVFEKI